MRPRTSIRGCVRPSVGPSVGPSVRNAFVKIAENGVMQDGDASYVVYTALFTTFLFPLDNFLCFFAAGDSNSQTAVMELCSCYLKMCAEAIATLIQQH